MQHGGRRTVGVQSLFDQDQRIEILGRRCQVVVHDQQRPAGLLGAFQHVQNGLFRGGVDTGKRFVQQQDVRPLRHRAGHEHPLLLATGELPDLTIGEVGHADHLQGLVGQSAVFPAQVAPPGHVAVTSHHRHFADRDRKVPIDRTALRHIGDATLCARSAGWPKIRT